MKAGGTDVGDKMNEAQESEKKGGGSVEERVINIICEQMGVPREKVAPETHFINDLGADSLDTVELVMEFEDEFDINIPDDEAEKITTVGDAINYIQSKI